MEELNNHMKHVHQESDYDRIVRVTETVKSVQQSIKVNNDQMIKSFDCTECGLLFKTSDDQKSHNQKEHASGLIPEIVNETKYEEKLIDLTESENSSSDDDNSEVEDNINIEYEYTNDS